MLDVTKLKPGDRFIDEYKDECFVICIGRDGRLIGDYPDSDDIEEHNDNPYSFPDAEDVVVQELIVFKSGGQYWNQDNDDNNYWDKCELVKKKQQKKTKEKKMSKSSDLSFVDSILSSNRDAATEAAKLNGAKIALDTLKKVAGANLPDSIAEQVETPIGTLVIANIVAQLVPSVTDNELAIEMSEAALVAAYQEVIAQLGIHAIVEQFVNGFTAPIQKKTTKGK